MVASGGTTGTKDAFSADSDVNVFDDALMIAGLKYYFLRAKKLDFGVEMAQFNDILSVRKASDVPAQRQSLAPLYPSEPYWPSIPDGSWSL